MSDFNFENFESLSGGLSTLKNNVPESDFEKLSSTLKRLFTSLEKSKEYMSVIGFMKATGQGTKTDVIEYELNEELSSFSKQKDIILSFFKSKNFSNLTLKKSGKSNFSFTEKENAILKGKKLEALFKKGLTLPKESSPENKARVRVMEEKFRDDYKRRLENVAKFLPLQTANRFIDLMLQYEKFANFNVSDQEKLAKSREIDEELANIGCVNLKYLVINDRNCMISNMLSANTTGEIREAVQTAYSSFYISPMENDNYRNASIITETLKISYLFDKGLADEYGEKSLQEINFATKTNTIERYVFTPSPADAGLIDEDSLNTIESINHGINEMFDFVFPPTNPALPQSVQTHLSQNFIDNTMQTINLIDNLKNVSEAKRTEMKQQIVAQTSSSINDRLSKESNNALRYSRTLDNNKLTQTFIHEDDNLLTETSATTNLNQPDKYDTRKVTKEIIDVQIFDENGNKTNYPACIESYEGTIYTSTEDALVFENTPTTKVLSMKDPITKEDITIKLDEDSLIVEISGNETIAKQLHERYIESLPEDELERYQTAFFEKEQEKKELQQNKEINQNKQNVDSEKHTEVHEANQNVAPSPKEIWDKRNEIEAENEDVMVMLPKRTRQ